MGGSYNGVIVENIQQNLTIRHHYRKNKSVIYCIDNTKKWKKVWIAGQVDIEKGMKGDIGQDDRKRGLELVKPYMYIEQGQQKTTYMYIVTCTYIFITCLTCRGANESKQKVHRRSFLGKITGRCCNLSTGQMINVGKN